MEDVPLERKIAQVRTQLANGQALVVFNPRDESCTIVTAAQWRRSAQERG